LTHINIGIGKDITIKGLAETISNIVGYNGHIEYDTSKPDGMPQKLLDVARLHSLGWDIQISLEKRIKETYNWYIKHAQ